MRRKNTVAHERKRSSASRATTLNARSKSSLVPSLPGSKHDAGKPRFDLIPPAALRSVAQVLAHGAEKYGDENWRGVPDARSRYLAAAYRHLNAWHRGEITDEDSGQPHLAHAICCALFLLEQP